MRLWLNKQGVQAVIHYVPLHDSPMGRELGYAPEDLPVTRHEAASLLRLPMHDNLSDADLDKVVSEIHAFFD
jgi:dTDP-4-amino-4,6-dideoxygalactose transaminase